MPKSYVGSGHVLAKGATSAPFPPLSGSVAEGWIDYTHGYNQYFSAYNFSYNVFYNFPSDGVDIYSNNSHVVGSPAWAPAGKQTVSGSWYVSSSNGVMIAQATASLFIQGFPVMFTSYDHFYF